MATLYSLEESLERSAVAVLGTVAALADCQINPADVSDEETLPLIYVRAEKQDELVLNMGTWNARLVFSITASADEDGIDAFNSAWKSLVETVSDSSFAGMINDEELCHVWGMEREPINYENNERTFSRSIPVRCWVNAVEAPVE